MAYNDLIRKRSRGLMEAKATIEHKITASYGGITYDVITVRGGLDVVKKKLGTGVTAAGQVTRRTPRYIARALKYPIVINADRFSAPNGSSYTTSEQALGRGLQIADGIPYREWQEGTSATTAYVHMRDGTYRVATKADDQAAGKLAKDWVNEGAVWSVCAWMFAVIDGVAQTLVDDEKSARTILGRKKNGDWVFILVEGVSGVYGINYSDVPALCLAEGMYVAYLLDGGGSTQCWWGDCYAVPSSDTGDPFASLGDNGRKTGGFICIDVPEVPQYDSGQIDLTLAAGLTANAPGYPGIWVRQHGPLISVGIDATASPALADDIDKVLSVNDVPARYFGQSAAAMRGTVLGQESTAGAVAWPIPVIVSGTGTLTLRTGVAGKPGLGETGRFTGEWLYRQRWS